MKVEYVDHMGTDLSVVDAARVSFSKKSELQPDGTLRPTDVSLIQYLARGMSKKEWVIVLDEIATLGDTILWEVPIPEAPLAEIELENKITTLMDMAKHWVPFTHTAISLRMSAPVPIRVQCFKHKIGFTESEESRRYISSRPELFIPDFREAAVDKKQGSGGPHPGNDKWKNTYTSICTSAITLYEGMIADGIAPEQARFILPQGVEVNWIWTGNLASFARYVNQRIDPHAQQESQDLAQLVSDIIRPYFPVSWDALVKSGRTE